MLKLIRGYVLHTLKNPFFEEEALEGFEDGALLIEKGKILELGDFSQVSKRYPDADVIYYKDAFILPGFVDCHVHYPQVPIIGAMGLRLLEWLDTRTLPEEARLADSDYARTQARVFLGLLARNGTTTALVFGAHFKEAMHVFFDEADKSGLRITSGLVLGDRLLKDELHTDPDKAYAENLELIRRWHNHGRLRYAVTPRFSLSCSDELLAVCGRLLKEQPDLFFTSHINEQIEEIETVLELFEDSSDYLSTYEKHGLVGKHSVFAHNVHVSDSELGRLAKAESSIAHCASSNMFIGSGLFDMKRHLEHQVQFALGSDVGGGTGFSLFKEGLMAYQGQMLQLAKGFPLTATQLLYLATLAGAKALHLDQTVGNFAVGKEADFMIVKAPDKSTLKQTLEHSPSAEASLAALFTLAREDSLLDVFVSGESVFV
ncbi:MAG: guanine deaminase [Trueperaceae bacterium]|nr:guanine deaminase [Trueperaceae bacterium]